MSSSVPSRRLATIYNNTLLALDETRPSTLVYLPLTSGSTLWKRHPCASGEDEAPEARDVVHAAILAAADTIFVAPLDKWARTGTSLDDADDNSSGKPDGSLAASSAAVPRRAAKGGASSSANKPPPADLHLLVHVLDCRRMAWSREYILLPEEFETIDTISYIVPSKETAHHDGAGWFVGNATYKSAPAPGEDDECAPPSSAKGGHGSGGDSAENSLNDDPTQTKKANKKRSQNSGMFVLEIDFTMKLAILLNVAQQFVCPIRWPVAFSLPYGNGVLLCAGEHLHTRRKPNEETILWMWGEDLPGQLSAGVSRSDTRRRSTVYDEPQRSTLEGQSMTMLMHPYDDEDGVPTTLVDTLLAENITRVFSTMPCEYTPNHFFWFDEAARRLVWVGPSTWYLLLDNPFRSWKRLRNPKGQPCRCGIPTLGTQAIVCHDVPSGRQLLIEPNGPALYICNTCDAPARVVPIYTLAPPAKETTTTVGGGGPASSSSKAGTLQPLVTHRPAPPGVAKPQPFTNHSGPESIYAMTPSKPKAKKPASQKKRSKSMGASEEEEDDERDKLAAKINNLLAMARKTRHQIAPPLKVVLLDDTQVVLDLSLVTAVDPEEFFCIRQVLKHCPWVIALRLYSMAFLSDQFLEGLAKLPMILELEFADESAAPPSRAAAAALDAILDRHRVDMEHTEMKRDAVRDRKDARRQRRSLIKEETAFRRSIREQLLLIIGEQIGRIVQRQLEGRAMLLVRWRQTLEALTHNRTIAGAFLDLRIDTVVFESAGRSKITAEEQREWTALAKEAYACKTDIFRRERLALDKIRREEADRFREMRRKQRETLEAFADVERKARHVRRQEEEQSRVDVAKQGALMLDMAKERMYKRQREEAEARTREFERLKRIDEIERLHLMQVIEVIKAESSKRIEIKKEEDKLFIPFKPVYLSEGLRIRTALTYAQRRKDRLECEGLLPVLKLDPQYEIRSNVRIPKLNTCPQRIFYLQAVNKIRSSMKAKDSDALMAPPLTVEVPRVPHHLTMWKKKEITGEPLEPPLEPGELDFDRWTALKRSLDNCIIRISVTNFPQGIDLVVFGKAYRVEDNILYLLQGKTAEPVGSITQEEYRANATVNVDPNSAKEIAAAGDSVTVFTVRHYRILTPQDALDFMVLLAFDTSNCCDDSIDLQLNVTTKLTLCFTDMAQTTTSPRHDLLLAHLGEHRRRSSFSNTSGFFTMEQSVARTEEAEHGIMSHISMRCTVTLDPAYIRIPRDDLVHPFTEGDAPLPLLSNCNIVTLDPNMLLDCNFKVTFVGGSSDENDQIQLSPNSRFQILPDSTILHTVFNSTFGKVVSKGCLHCPTIPDEALPEEMKPHVEILRKMAKRLVRRLGDEAKIRLRTCVFRVLTRDVTPETLTAFIRGLEFINTSQNPVGGERIVRVLLMSPTSGINFSREMVINFESVDNPVELHMNLSAVTFRVPPAISQGHQKFVSQPHCYFGQFATVVDPDTTSFKGGYLKVHLEGYVSGDLLDIAPRDGISLSADETQILYLPPTAAAAAADPTAAAAALSSSLCVAAAPVGTPQAIALIVREGAGIQFLFRQSSIAATEALLRCLTFSTKRTPKPGLVMNCAIHIALSVEQQPPVTASIPLKISEPLFLIQSNSAYLTYKEGAPPTPLPPLRMCVEDSNWCGGWISVDFTTGFMSGEDWFVLNETNLLKLVDPTLEARRASKAGAKSSAAAATVKGMSTMMIKAGSKPGGPVILGLVRDVYIADLKIGTALLTLDRLRVDFVKETDKSPRASKFVSKKDVAMVFKHVFYKNLSDNPKSTLKIVVVTCIDGGAQASSCPIQIDVQATDSPTEIIVDEAQDRTFRLGTGSSAFMVFDHCALRDPDSYSFNGASFSVELVSGGDPSGYDVISLMPHPADLYPLPPSLLTLDPKKNVLLNGRLVAKVSGGGAQPLVVKFNPYPKGVKLAQSQEQADMESHVYILLSDCLAVLKRVAFTSSSSRPLPGQRVYMLKFTYFGLSSQAKVPLLLVPSQLVNQVTGAQPRYDTKAKRPVAPFGCLQVMLLSAKKAQLTVSLVDNLQSVHNNVTLLRSSFRVAPRLKLSAPALNATTDLSGSANRDDAAATAGAGDIRRDLLQLLLPDKAELTLKGQQLFDGKLLIGDVTQDSPQAITLSYDASSKIQPKHAQAFVRSVHFSTTSTDGFERLAEVSLASSPTEKSTLYAAIQVVADDEPTEILLDAKAQLTVHVGALTPTLLAGNATVVDPDTEHFHEPDNIMVVVQKPIPTLDCLLIAGLPEDATEVTEHDRVLARISHDRPNATMKLDLVDITLIELQILVRRIAYLAKEDLSDSVQSTSDARCIGFTVRTGKSFSRTNLVLALVQLLFSYSGRDQEIPIIPGADGQVQPFESGLQCRDSAFFGSFCKGTVSLQTSAPTLKAVFALALKPPQDDAMPRVTLQPWPDGSRNILFEGKKAGMVHLRSPTSIEFAVVPGHPLTQPLLQRILQMAAVSVTVEFDKLTAEQASQTAVMTLTIQEGEKLQCKTSVSLLVGDPSQGENTGGSRWPSMAMKSPSQATLGVAGSPHASALKSPRRGSLGKSPRDDGGLPVLLAHAGSMQLEPSATRRRSSLAAPDAATKNASASVARKRGSFAKTPQDDELLCSGTLGGSTQSASFVLSPASNALVPLDTAPGAAGEEEGSLRRKASVKPSASLSVTGTDATEIFAGSSRPADAESTTVIEIPEVGASQGGASHKEGASPVASSD